MFLNGKNKLTVFVLNNNLEAAGKLRKYLKRKLKNNVQVSIFLNCKSCLRKIDDNVDAIVLTDFLYYWGKDGIHGNLLLEQIRLKNPYAQIIITNRISVSALPICRLRQHVNAFPSAGKYKFQLTGITNRFLEQPFLNLVADIGLKNFMKTTLLLMTLIAGLYITLLIN